MRYFNILNYIQLELIKQRQRLLHAGELSWMKNDWFISQSTNCEVTEKPVSGCRMKMVDDNNTCV